MFLVTSSHAALLQLKKGWPWTAEATDSPFKQLSYGVCLTWACWECHQFLQIFFYPVPLIFGYIEDVFHLSSRLGLQALDDQLFGLWLNLWHAVRGQVALHMKVWCAGVLFIHTWECVNYSICHRWSSNLWVVESFKDTTRLLFKQNLTFLS